VPIRDIREYLKKVKRLCSIKYISVINNKIKITNNTVRKNFKKYFFKKCFAKLFETIVWLIKLLKIDPGKDAIAKLEKNMPTVSLSSKNNRENLQNITAAILKKLEANATDFVNSSEKNLTIFKIAKLRKLQWNVIYKI